MRPKRRLSTVLFAAALLGLMAAGEGRADTLDFEGFTDSTILTTQYPGLTFTNTIILTSGISLNEFELPPHSGVNVASDNNGPITIDFSNPITSFSAYFTYLEPLTVAGFDSSNTEVANAISQYSTNDALYGDPGSSPNELIGITDAAGMSSVTITGDPLGSSFVMDDMSYTSATPEPDTLLLIGVVLIGLVALQRYRGDKHNQINATISHTNYRYSNSHNLSGRPDCDYVAKTWLHKPFSNRTSKCIGERLGRPECQ